MAEIDDKNKKRTTISVEVEFSDGYRERFTTAIMKIYEKKIRNGKPIIGRDDKSA